MARSRSPSSREFSPALSAAFNSFWTARSVARVRWSSSVDFLRAVLAVRRGGVGRREGGIGASPLARLYPNQSPLVHQVGKCRFRLVGAGELRVEGQRLLQ